MNLFPAQLQKAFITFETTFQQAYQEAQPKWSRFAMERTSDTTEEDYAWMAKVPELQEWVSERTIYNIAARLQTLRNKRYQGAIKIQRETIEDDKIGVFMPAMAELGKRAALWPDKITTQALIDGATAIVYDNQYFYDVDHPIDMDDPASATQANLFANSPLNADNLALVRAKGMELRGEDGVPMEIEYDTLIVPAGLEYTARKLLQAETIVAAGGASGEGAAAPQNVLRGMMDLIVLPRLGVFDSETSWYAARLKGAIKPLVFQKRIAPEFTILNNPGDPNVFERDQYLMGVRARGAAGYGPWWLISKSTA